MPAPLACAARPAHGETIVTAENGQVGWRADHSWTLEHCSRGPTIDIRCFRSRRPAPRLGVPGEPKHAGQDHGITESTESIVFRARILIIGNWRNLPLAWRGERFQIGSAPARCPKFDSGQTAIGRNCGALAALRPVDGVGGRLLSAQG